MAEKEFLKATIAEPGATGGENLPDVIKDRRKTYDPHARNKSVGEMRQDNTAMIPNETAVYTYTKDTNGNWDKTNVQMIFGAGWYLSVAEDAIKTALLKDADIKELNDKMLERAKLEGGKTRVRPAARDIRILN